jgi:thiamine biosynthesis lipoprotein ApbE
VLAVALDAARRTGGLVDPTLVGRWQDLRLTEPLLGRPPGLALDLNGVVKALAVDRTLELISGPAFVSAGGDVAVRGSRSSASRAAESFVCQTEASQRAARRAGRTTSSIHGQDEHPVRAGRR